MRTSIGIMGAACCLALGATTAEADAPAAKHALTMQTQVPRTAAAPDGVRLVVVGSRGVKVKTCGAKLADPHDSHHVPGTINAVAVVTCNYKPKSITTSILLKRGPAVFGTGNGSNRGKKRLAVNAAAPCTPGRYHAIASTTVIPAAGVKPQNIEGSSKGRKIDCR